MKKQAESLTEKQLNDFHAGRMIDAYEYFGAHCKDGETVFTVWAPDVKRVHVVSFNPQTGIEEQHELNTHPSDVSIWQVSIPKNMAGCRYEYELETPLGEVLRKSDPYAKAAELRPGTRSVVTGPSVYTWSDKLPDWKTALWENHFEKPMAIYEVHLGTWKRKASGDVLTYRECADQLIPYVKECGFTHIEILPITEHPLDESWGYQTTGFFAVTSRYGTADDLKYFIDQCAANGIGLFLDWVPGHFCTDSHALPLFNGTPLYEEARAERRHNHDWGTINFDVQKGEIVSFLLSSAHYWLKEFKFDGMRMDALVSHLFVPNMKPRTQDEEGAAFFRKLTVSLRQHYPEAILIGEDAWHFPKVTHKPEEGGLGFDYKWNFGWMHDTLTYMKTLPEDRPSHHGKMNFAMMYQYDDRFILSLSHDEVTQRKKSMLSKMPGTLEEKFHQLRLLYGFWIAHPGKKLLFMGQEFGQEAEWEFQPQLDWDVRDTGLHQKLVQFLQDMLSFYKQEKALFELDDKHEGFCWLDPDNKEQSVASFIRRGHLPEDECIVLCNFSNRRYSNFSFGVPHAGVYKQVFSTDEARYGGTGDSGKRELRTKERPLDGQRFSIEAELPAYSVIIWKHNPKGSEGE